MKKQKNTAAPFLRKSKLYLLLFSAFLLLLLIFIYWKWALLPVNDQELKQKVFIIKRGESLSSIANHLEKEGLIRSSLAFRVLVFFKGKAGKIQAGGYSLKPSLPPLKIIEILTRGRTDVWLTFPEGWRREEYAQRLEANLLNFDTNEFLDLTANLEGKLFPDTYLIPLEATPSAVVKIFLENFQKKTQGLELKESELILASIIEREVKFDEDRALVAGILLKRLKNNWPLQADATIQYAIANLKLKTKNTKIDNYWALLRKEDLKIDSPFNTYKYRGLPPSPICNPGLSSIKAVLEAKESPFWYYLSDSQGKIHYAKTLEEHNLNIQKFLK